MTGTDVWALTYLLAGLLTAIAVVRWAYQDEPEVRGDTVLFTGLAAGVVWPIVALTWIIAKVVNFILDRRDK